MISSDETVDVSLKVKNTGQTAGAEVVQLYVQDTKSSLPRPAKELKAFQKIRLEPGEVQAVTMQLSPRSFAFWDVATNGWKIEPGDFKIYVGTSVADTPLVESIEQK